MAEPREGTTVKATSVARRRMRERLEIATARREFKDSRPWWPAYPPVMPPGSPPPYPTYVTDHTELLCQSPLEMWVKP